MTKARARERAKAKVAQKSKKRENDADQPGKKFPSGQFDPGLGSIKSPRMNAETKNFSRVKRGSARSG